MSKLLSMLMKKKGGNEPYIESDGVAYTNLTINSSTTQVRRVDLKFQFVEIPQYQGGVFGVRSYTQYSSQRFGIIKTGSTLDFCAGSGDAAKRQELPLNTQKQEHSLSTPNGVWLYLSDLIAFGMKSNSYPSGVSFFPSKVRIFYIDFYYLPTSDSPSYSFRPKIVNNEVGLYEEINGVFCPNIAGSGQLTYRLG